MVKVLRGAPPAGSQEEQPTSAASDVSRRSYVARFKTRKLAHVFGGGAAKVKFPVFAFAVELHRQHGCGSGHRRLQRSPELLHEQAEKPPEHADVHRPVQPIPSECGTEEVVSESPW